MKKDGARYFGPYTRAGSLRETLRTLRRVFPYRTCTDHRMRTASRPCLDYQIRRCAGPCVGRVSPEDYRAMMEEMCLFLEGRQADLVSRLRERMEKAAAELEFEKAAELRDQLRALEDVMARQTMISTDMEDQDVVGYARSDRSAMVAVQVFFVREGKVVGRSGFILDDTGGRSGPDIIAAFLKQYYSDEAVFVPARVLVPEPLEDEEREPIEEWLSARRGRKVTVHRPQRGKRRELVRVANRNAVVFLQEEELRRLARSEDAYTRVTALQEALDLPRVPQRIEGYDISNIRGREAVGSMVVFIGGRPTPARYRRFRVRTKAEPDDYAMMQEVLFRRLRRLRRGTGGTEGEWALAERDGDTAPAERDGGAAPSERNRERGEDPDRLGPAPDLILIDGGKGHLAAAAEVLEDLGLDIPLVALAKEHEHLFLPGQADPLVLPEDSPALHLLRHIRDEAHRFAVGYHRLLRRKRARRSELDDVPGVGPARRTALLKAFGSARKVREARLEELAAVPGIGPAAARRIWEHFHGGRVPPAESEREDGGGG